MNVPFLDLKQQYEPLWKEIEPEIHKIFESCSFIGGSVVQNFERQMEEYLGVKHAMGCNSGTDALVLALRACGIKPGDEVITTAFTFFATAEAIAVTGAIPVFVDIKESDYTIDPEKIEEAVTEKTKAILPVHIFGALCDMDAIMEIAGKHDLKVIEDDAQAIGSSYKGRKAGTLGDVGCFSFYPTKNLGGCGDGGMVTTNDDELDTILRALHEHGAGKNGAKALKALRGGTEELSSQEKVTALYDPFKYYNYLIGYNSRLDALQACVLTVKLKYLDEYNRKRKRIADKYRAGITDKVVFPQYGEDTIPCWHQFVILSEYKESLCAYLGEHGVGCGTFYPVPMHRQKAFHDSNSRGVNSSLPTAEKVSAQSVCLPIFPEMSDEQVQYVIDTVNQYYEEKINE